jgi:hypothetical protein
LEVRAVWISLRVKGRWTKNPHHSTQIRLI